jgi:hypothetical protein
LAGARAARSAGGRQEPHSVGGSTIAEDTVNKLAEGQTKAVTALLDAFGAALEGFLDLLEAGMLAVVDVYAAVVNGAISFAEGVATGFGVFAALVGDIVDDPGGWVGNVISAVADGIKNHLWAAFKTAVKEWFSNKIAGLVAIGDTLWKLVTGQLGLAQIAQLAIDAIKAVLPQIVIRVVLSQVAKLVNPVVGGIITIIESVQAAWGTISQLIASINLFVDFLSGKEEQT